MYLERSESVVSYKISNILYNERKKAGYSQSYVAKKAKLARSTVGNMEKGSTGYNICNLSQYLSVLGISWSEFGARLHNDLILEYSEKNSNRLS